MRPTAACLKPSIRQLGTKPPHCKTTVLGARTFLRLLRTVSSTRQKISAAQQLRPLCWGTTDAPNASMPCPHMTLVVRKGGHATHAVFWPAFVASAELTLGTFPSG